MTSDKFEVDLSHEKVMDVLNCRGESGESEKEGFIGLKLRGLAFCMKKFGKCAALYQWEEKVMLALIRVRSQ